MARRSGWSSAVIEIANSSCWIGRITSRTPAWSLWTKGTIWMSVLICWTLIDRLSCVCAHARLAYGASLPNLPTDAVKRRCGGQSVGGFPVIREFRRPAGVAAAWTKLKSLLAAQSSHRIIPASSGTPASLIQRCGVHRHASRFAGMTLTVDLPYGDAPPHPG